MEKLKGFLLALIGIAISTVIANYVKISLDYDDIAPQIVDIYDFISGWLLLLVITFVIFWTLKIVMPRKFIVRGIFFISALGLSFWIIYPKGGLATSAVTWLNPIKLPENTNFWRKTELGFEHRQVEVENVIEIYRSCNLDKRAAFLILEPDYSADLNRFSESKMNEQFMKGLQCAVSDSSAAIPGEPNDLQNRILPVESMIKVMIPAWNSRLLASYSDSTLVRLKLDEAIRKMSNLQRDLFSSLDLHEFDRWIAITKAVCPVEKQSQQTCILLKTKLLSALEKRISNHIESASDIYDEDHRKTILGFCSDSNKKPISKTCVLGAAASAGEENFSVTLINLVKVHNKLELLGLPPSAASPMSFDLSAWEKAIAIGVQVKAARREKKSEAEQAALLSKFGEIGVLTLEKSAR